jgi:hypothetical protein
MENGNHYSVMETLKTRAEHVHRQHVLYISKMAAEPENKYSKEQLESEEVSKKDILSFLQENASKAVGLILYFAQIIAQS